MLLRRKWQNNSIRLEACWWARIDALSSSSGASWREFVTTLLAGKPADRTRPSWLREALM